MNDDKNRVLYLKSKELADKEKNVIFGGYFDDYQYYDMDATVASLFDKCKKELI